MGIGITLSELIKRKNTNVNELATKTGISAQTIYGIIKRDNKKVDFEVLVKISKMLGVNVEYFYNAEYDTPNLNLRLENEISNNMIELFNKLSPKFQNYAVNQIESLLKLQEETKESE